jgi:hypothetical protein
MTYSTCIKNETVRDLFDEGGKKYKDFLSRIVGVVRCAISRAR